MADLIKALQIFLKYANDDKNPTNCSHDELLVGCGIREEDMIKEDLAAVVGLGFFWSSEYESFVSYRYGSC